MVFGGHVQVNIKYHSQKKNQNIRKCSGMNSAVISCVNLHIKAARVRCCSSALLNAHGSGDLRVYWRKFLTLC